MVIKSVDYHYYGKENLKDNWGIKLLDGEFYEGNVVTVEVDGKRYKRKVYYGNGDLYIRIGNYKYFSSDVI